MKIINLKFRTLGSSEQGQVMLLTVLALTAITLATALISGLLTINQIRQAHQITESTRAIFAADTGIEHELYKAFINSNYPAPTMTNGATFTTTNLGSAIRSVGQSRDALRALKVSY